MVSYSSISLFFFFFFSFRLLVAANPTPDPGVLSSCLRNTITAATENISASVHAPNAADYASLLYFTMQNLRFNSSDKLKPSIIITPKTESEISAAIVCCKKKSFHMRILSGGHDYEGLSYVTQDVPFVILDLLNFRNITVDTVSNTAWVGAGATLGELYYRIAEHSKTLGFPAGICSTLGAGGHISGGGTGTVSRKYGLASDYVIDAKIVDVNGNVLDRKSMGEDIFWAIRGGGGTSFGVIIAWKIKLVNVPEIVTAFDITKTGNSEEAILVLDKWQQTIKTLPDDLFIRAGVSAKKPSKETPQFSLSFGFSSLFLGRAKDLLQLMTKEFPEMGLKIEDCHEMSWIESLVHFNRFPKGSPTTVLLDRENKKKRYFKSKSDIVKTPIPKKGWEGLFDLLLQQPNNGLMMDPHGGKMFGVVENEFPFPHRYDDIYHIKYSATWSDVAEEKGKIEWLRKVYAYMAPYVTQNPRGAYINYRDLDVGMDVNGSSSYEDSLEWGLKYFKGNYERLALLKGKVDPENFFRNEQSVFPLKR